MLSAIVGNQGLRFLRGLVHTRPGRFVVRDLEVSPPSDELSVPFSDVHDSPHLPPNMRTPSATERDLVEHGVVTGTDAEPFIADLVWMGETLEHLRPKARAFVRPAFDEPEAVEQFLANHRGS